MRPDRFVLMYLLLLVVGLVLVLMGSYRHAHAIETYLQTETRVSTSTEEYEKQEAHVRAVADTLFAVEGRCGTWGASEEYGCYQYLQKTWVAYSTQINGHVLPQTQSNERLVTEGMVRLWLAEGVSDRGIFLTWNQGTPGPDCYKGTNDHGVAYDSCNYAERALRILKEKENPATSAGE